MKGSIGVPTMGGIKSAFTDALVGAGSGFIYSVSRSIFGSGLIGSLVSIVAAGAFLKGNRQTAVATVAGFMAVAGGLGGNSTNTQAAASTENVRGTM